MINSLYWYNFFQAWLSYIVLYTVEINISKYIINIKVSNLFIQTILSVPLFYKYFKFTCSLNTTEMTWFLSHSLSPDYNDFLFINWEINSQNIDVFFNNMLTPTHTFLWGVRHFTTKTLHYQTLHYKTLHTRKGCEQSRPITFFILCIIWDFFYIVEIV